MIPPGIAPGELWRVKDKLPCHWQRVDFQPRDLLFLRVLLEQKFLSHEQILDFIYSGKKRYAYIRLWKLRRFGFVKKVVGFTGSALYLPTDQTYDYFKSCFVEVPTPVACPDPRTVFHDLQVTDVRFLFEQMGFGRSWTSERLWKMGRSVRLWAPDGVISVGGDSFAVEVKRVQKENVRYEDIFARYQNDLDLAACLYITTDKLLPLLLEKALDSQAIFFTTLRELFEKKEKTAFRNANGNVLEIGDNLERILEARSNTKPSQPND